jgi:ribosomal-protein-alanine N-acetyltransferase
MIPHLTTLPAGAAAALSLMHAACFPDDPWDAAVFARLLGLHGLFGHIAWLDDAPVGFVLARDLGSEAEVLTLGVLPAARRRGIGRALLDAVVTQMARRHGHSLVLEVAADNMAARRLYEAMGFVRVGARPCYYRRGQTAIDALVLRRAAAADADRDGGDRVSG